MCHMNEMNASYDRHGIHLSDAAAVQKFQELSPIHSSLPLLEDGSFVLTESSARVFYIVDKIGFDDAREAIQKLN